MARDRNTFAKHQRETRKRQKAEDKRARRREKKTCDPGEECPDKPEGLGGEQEIRP